MSVIVFDAYGTLFNLDALIPLATELIGDAAKAEKFCFTWRNKQLSYTWTSVLMQRYQDFDKLTEHALSFALQDAAINDTDAYSKLLHAHQTLPIYDDVPPALNRLSESHKLVILSNGTFRSLQTLTNHQNILFSFDYILSVDPIRTYKPSRAAYQLVLDSLKCNKEDVVFVSSNHWDVTGAKAFGFKTLWCNRSGATPDFMLPQPDATIASLYELLL